MTKRKTNPDFLTGVPELLVLRLLSRKPMHGYAVVQAISAATDGQLTFREGSIYPVLHRLESEKKLTTKTTEHNGRQRVIYRTTKKGLAQLEESRDMWLKIAKAIDKVFDNPEEGHGSPGLA